MWQRIKDFFHDSETIFWARLQVFIGVVAEILTYVPAELWSPVIPPRWFGIFLLLNGLATEYLRRRRSDLGKAKDPDWEP